MECPIHKKEYSECGYLPHRNVVGRKCIIKDCPCEKIVARGLCQTCYSSAMNYINMGQATWGEFEGMGLCLPKRSKGKEYFKNALCQKRQEKK